MLIRFGLASYDILVGMHMTRSIETGFDISFQRSLVLNVVE